MFSAELLEQARQLVHTLSAKGLTISTAESCTGGLIAALITETPGSSAVFTHGYVTYANEAKTQMIGVSAELIATHGAVSEEVARAMAEGALRTSGADIAVAVTGIAGPGGGTEAKPVGLVYVACAKKTALTFHQRCLFIGDRNAVRAQAVAAALALI